MPRLRRLLRPYFEDEPWLEDVLKAFSTVNVNSVEEMLSMSPAQLSDRSGVSLERVERVGDRVYEGLDVPKEITARELSSLSSLSPLLPLPSPPPLNFLIGPTLPVSHLIELAGASSTGKTQICFQAAVMGAGSTDRPVVWIECSNGFSAQRMSSLLMSLTSSSSSTSSSSPSSSSTHAPSPLAPSLSSQASQRARGEEEGLSEFHDHVMSRVHVFPVHSVFSLLSLLFSLDSRLSDEEDELQGSGLVVVDGLGVVLSTVMEISHLWQGFSLLSLVSRLLKHIAFSHRLTVLYTNYAVGNSDKAALGESWAGVPHHRLLLIHEPSLSLRLASLLKSPSQPLDTNCAFEITDKGITFDPIS